MKFRIPFVCSCLFFQISISSAQKEKPGTIEFHPIFGNSILVLSDRYYKLGTGDSLRIETLKFYVSGIELLNEDVPVWKEKNSYHLIDASNKKSLTVSLEKSTKLIFNKIKFNVGIDSMTNVSGAMPGDLDPTLGMYWTWQSGYINFKLEGNSNLCNSRNHEFQFHLGGYVHPFNSLQTVVLSANKNEIPAIVLDIEKFISAPDLINENHIMTPGKHAVLLSDKLPGIFSMEKP